MAQIEDSGIFTDRIGRELGPERLVPYFRRVLSIE